MKTEYITLKEATLSNNCPECYATESLLLSFKQKKVTSSWKTKITDQLTEQMVCTQCKSTIFPGQWNIDIERVYEYHKKTIGAPQSVLQFTTLFYGLLVVLALLLIAGIGYFFFYV